ncbi:MAG: hypothetical protein IPJ69_09960 [Deltaproteobacteria bacterium]|nr:MAG: hypothetical protein IPJ69_09960 [Deltaproteobacteria bacterium]
MAGIHVRFDITPEAFVADLTKAVYDVALKNGVKGSFLSIELDLQKALYEVVKKEMLGSEKCGSPDCRKAERFELDSEKSKTLFKED